MATDVASEIEKSAKINTDLLTFVRKELDADAERQAKLQASGVGGLPHESQGVTLDITHKNLRSLPVEVISLIKDKVERLALSHNSQISVPPQIAQCERLRYLNIRWNQLIHFPVAVLQLTQLEILDVSKNRISEIPEGIKKLTSLKYLAVSRNRITKLPYALGEMSSLGKLKFDENPITFPPPEALKLSSDPSTSAFEAEREADTCQKVKRFLRAAAVKEKLKTVSEEDLSESNVETPRPPKRIATGGRFPIRPSISGLESMTDTKPDSPAEPPPVPQRSHARGESTNAPVPRRPGIAPLLTAGNDFGRSQSEMVSSASAVNLRSRRQGVVPPRRPTGGLGSVTEAAPALSQGGSMSVSHSRAASSVSATSTTGLDAGDATGVFSPERRRIDNSRALANLSEHRNLKDQGNSVLKGSKRLNLLLSELDRPMSDIADAIKEGGDANKSNVQRQIFIAKAHMKELDRVLILPEDSTKDGAKLPSKTTNNIIRAAVHALKSYSSVAVELKRHRDRIISRADGFYIRTLMFKIYSSMVEARNICTVLGFNVRDANAPGVGSRQVSAVYSSKSVTPTQPKAPATRRMAKPAMLHSVGGTALRNMPPPPPMPLSTNTSRSNTMTSQSSTLVPTNPLGSRTNTMRSAMDDGGEEQFDQIFLKLQAACNLASQALPHCRSEIQARKEGAQNSNQRNIAHQWSLALSKCDEVISNNKALKKRLEIVKVNDPGLRYQRDFWQLCDAFVHSWTELATEVKELSSQRVDISTIKQIMRNVQKNVKDVSKTISNSPLYHHALGNVTKGGSDGFQPPGLASPLPMTMQPAYANSGGYATPIPATPLSAALGPAIQATVATPNTTTVPREYFQEPTTARQVRAADRNDTPMQPPYARRY